MSRWLVLGSCLLCTPNLMAQASPQSAQQMLVRFQPQVSMATRDSLMHQLGAHPVDQQTPASYEVWELSDLAQSRNRPLPGQKPLRRKLEEHPAVLQVEPNYAYQSFELPDDPMLDQQWALHHHILAAGQQPADIRMEEAWQVHHGDDVMLGLIDTGLDFGHEDLQENVWQNLAEDSDGDGQVLVWINGQWQLDPGDLDGIDNDQNGYVDDLIGWDFVNNDNNPFDDHGHGTHVAGIIAAKGNNGKGIAGISWGAKIMALKAFDQNGTGSLASILPALAYARKMGASLTQNSWGGASYSEFLYDELKAAEAADMLIVAAAGNQASNNVQTPIYPSSYPLDALISVAASNPLHQLASFSNYGHTVHLVAPGTDILSTLPGNQYGLKSGTSMAAPMVSGAICLLKSYQPALNAAQIKRVLLSTTTLLPGLADKCSSGGRLNVFEALRVVTDLCVDWLNQPINHIKDLAEEGQYLWAATSKGLLRLDKESCAIISFHKGNSPLKDNHLLAVAVDQQGIKWIGTEKEGMYAFDGVSWTHYPKSSQGGVPDKRVNAILVDAQNQKWIGTEKQGMVRFDGSTWQAYKKNSSSLPSNQISEMIMDEQGIMWIATHKGLAKFSGTSWTIYDKKNSSLPDDKVSSVALDGQGIAWIGTEKGAARFDGSNWTVYKKKAHQLPDEKVQSISLDQEGIPWFATQKGLVRFDGNQWLVYKKNNSHLPHDRVNSLVTDKINHIWAGTDGGIQVFFANAKAAFSGPAQTCIGQAITFQNFSSGGVDYEWQIAGQLVSTNQDFQHSFQAPGTYFITLLAKNDFSQDAITKTVRVMPEPQIELGPDTSVCAYSVLLYGGDPQLQFSWSSTGSIWQDTSRWVRVRQSGTYHLQATNACGISVSDSVSLTLNNGCIWPGDVNTDGMVNLLDFLSLGGVQGEVGISRQSSSTLWASQTGADWNHAFDSTHAFAAGVNYKHADCDGDGTVDLLLESAVIRQNATIPHQAPISSVSSDIRLEINHLQTTMLALDTAFLTYEARLLRQNGADLPGVHGLAFSLHYSQEPAAPPQLLDGPSWLGQTESLILHRDGKQVLGSLNPSLTSFAQQSEFGIVRSSILNVRGQGTLARIGIIVTLEDLSDDHDLLSYGTFSLSAGDLVILDSAGQVIPVSHQHTTQIETVKIPRDPSLSPQQPNLDFAFQLAPNPTQTQLGLELSLDEARQLHIRLLNQYGAQVWQRMEWLPAGTHSFSYPTGDLAAGLYWVEVYHEQGAQIKKLLVLPH